MGMTLLNNEPLHAIAEVVEEGGGFQERPPPQLGWRREPYRPSKVSFVLSLSLRSERFPGSFNFNPCLSLSSLWSLAILSITQNAANLLCALLLDRLNPCRTHNPGSKR